MVNAISSNISSLQLLRAQNAFSKVQTSAKTDVEAFEPQTEQLEQEISTPIAGTTAERLQNEIIDTIRDDLTGINEYITDEDIRYGLTFGRSILVDCSA